MKSLTELTKVDQSLATNKAFISRLRHLEQARAAIDAEYDALRSAMVKNGVQGIKGEWGSIQFVPTIYLKAEGDLPNRFTKRVIDSDKVRAYQVLRGNLPKGVKSVVVNKFVKRIK